VDPRRAADRGDRAAARGAGRARQPGDAVRRNRDGVRVPRRRVVAAAARPTRGPTAAGLGTEATRAIGSDPPNLTLPDVSTLCGLAVWSAVLVAALSLLADVVTVLLDPRVEARTR